MARKLAVHLYWMSRQMTTMLTGKMPLSETVDPRGKFLYVTHPQSAIISGYSINSDGSLASVPGSPFPAGASPAAITVDPSGTCVYVTDYSLNEVLAFSINSSGSLAPIAGSPFGPTSEEPSSIVVLGALQWYLSDCRTALDDVADDARYRIYTFITTTEKPRELEIADAVAVVDYAAGRVDDRCNVATQVEIVQSISYYAIGCPRRMARFWTSSSVRKELIQPR
jgi:DNA-binding beta-propeller fold protein YncE